MAHVSFNQERMARVERMERQHFWFVGRRKLLGRYLRRWVPVGSLVLDVGAGTAFNASWVSSLGYRVVGIEPLWEGRESPDGVAIVRALGERLPVRSGACDAVLFLDVLEHTDDEACLRECYRCLRPGGIVIVSVPAMPFLWSRRDEEAGHRRRYTASTLVRVLERGGFQVLDTAYYMFLLLPAIFASRLLGRFFSQVQRAEESIDGWHNRLGLACVAVETALGKYLAWPAGSTLLAAARRLPDSRSGGCAGTGTTSRWQGRQTQRPAGTTIVPRPIRRSTGTDNIRPVPEIAPTWCT